MRWHKLPVILFYAPVVPYVIYLCIKHRRSPAVIMSANPLFDYGGLPFSSKCDMQAHFDLILPYQLLPQTASVSERINIIESFVSVHGWPVIIKPDTGHRGVGIRKVDNIDGVADLLAQQKWDWMVQQYNADACEYGLFYHRNPSEEQGTIISITKKVIPEGSDLVAASHCRGAEFFNRPDLITPELIERVNQLCRDKAFYFGRFDMKSTSDENFAKGNFSIIEVNGATSEFIHILDDNCDYKTGMSELYRQWRILFETAISSEKKHTLKTRFSDFIKLYVCFFRNTYKAEGVIW